MSGARVTAVLALLVALVPGCAWSNRANRPVWDAFEQHVVPEHDAAFWVTLPATVPLGVGAILVDTFVAHPLAVIDDAADDAGNVWDDIAWEREYYTELAALPFRAVGTPLVFVVSFLGRSMFDVPENRSEEEVEADERARRLEAVAATRSWLDEVAAGERKGYRAAVGSRVWAVWTSALAEQGSRALWDGELQRAWERALGAAGASARTELYAAARQHGWPPLLDDPALGLRDADPVVRHAELRAWPKNRSIPAAVLAALAADPSESVRELAQARVEGR